MYIRYIYGIFNLKITKYTAYMYVYIRFWPTLCIYAVHDRRFGDFPAKNTVYIRFWPA